MSDTPRVFLTLDARHVFTGMDEPFGGACRIRVYETLHPAKGFPTVIVASQIAGSAPSVTNFAEDIATEVVRMHRARRRLAACDPRHAFVWVDHYPGGTQSLDPDGLYRLVTFTERVDGSLEDPQWKPVPREFVEASLIRNALLT